MRDERITINVADRPGPAQERGPCGLIPGGFSMSLFISFSLRGISCGVKRLLF